MSDLAVAPTGFPTDAIVSFTGYHAFLAMDYPCPTIVNGYMWPTLEHAYQSTRCEDSSYLARLRSCHDRAAAAKLIGQSLKTPDEWYSRRDGILFQLLQERYRNAGLRDLLLLTGEQMLIYGNLFHDTHLGMEWYRDDNGDNQLRGANLLGQMHMSIRAAIRLDHFNNPNDYFGDIE